MFRARRGHNRPWSPVIYIYIYTHLGSVHTELLVSVLRPMASKILAKARFSTLVLKLTRDLVSVLCPKWCDPYLTPLPKVHYPMGVGVGGWGWWWWGEEEEQIIIRRIIRCITYRDTNHLYRKLKRWVYIENVNHTWNLYIKITVSWKPWNDHTVTMVILPEAVWSKYMLNEKSIYRLYN